MSKKANAAAKTEPEPKPNLKLGLGRGLRARSRVLCLVATLVAAWGLYPQEEAQAWYVAIDGSVAPLSADLAGRVKIDAGVAVGHFHIGGSLSFIPVAQFVLYRGNSGSTEITDAYPVFVGAEARYYVRSRKPFTKKHDVYIGLGADFPVISQSFVPGVKIGGGYSLRLHRRVFLEMGVDYYFFGALTNELFAGLGIKTTF